MRPIPLVMLVAFLMVGCQRSGRIPGAEGEALVFPLQGRDWKLANVQSRPGRALVEYLPAGQTPGAWVDNLGGTFVAAGAGEALTLEAEARRLEEGVRAVCPSAAWETLRRSEDQLFYQYRLDDCPGQPDQTEIGRFVAKGRGVYRLAYVSKGDPLPPQERDAWVRRLAAAQVRASRR